MKEDNSMKNAYWLFGARLSVLAGQANTGGRYDLVEGWFSLLTKRRLQRGVFSSIDDLVDAIETWAEHWNDNPKPFLWTKTADAILAKTRRARAALDASATSATDH